MQWLKTGLGNWKVAFEIQSYHPRLRSRATSAKSASLGFFTCYLEWEQDLPHGLVRVLNHARHIEPPT